MKKIQIKTYNSRNAQICGGKKPPLYLINDEEKEETRMLQTKIKAFTLAEVLITIGIAGVVAAMTLPGLINKTNKKELKTAFQKAYTKLAEATNLVIAEGYPVYEYNDSDVDYNPVFAQEVYKKYNKLKKMSSAEKKTYKANILNYTRNSTGNGLSAHK